MTTEYLLEIVNHANGEVIGSEKGTAYFLSMRLQDILGDLPEGHGIVINEE